MTYLWLNYDLRKCRAEDRSQFYSVLNKHKDRFERVVQSTLRFDTTDFSLVIDLEIAILQAGGKYITVVGNEISRGGI